MREDEADLDKRFQDPERMARFASWAEKSLAGNVEWERIIRDDRPRAAFSRNLDQLAD